MLAAGELVSLTEEAAVSRTVIGPDSIFLDAEGRVEEALLFEMAAQTFAALAAAAAAGGPEAGFLAAVKKMDFHERPAIGPPVEVTAQVISRLDGFAVIRGRAVQAGRLLAEGQLTIFIPPDEPAP